MTREDEQNIIGQVIGGDSNAFEALVLENQTQVYNLCLKMTGSEEDAFDLSQEAFLKAFNNLDKFRGDSKFSVWLYRLTSNICIDFIRKKRRRQETSLSVEDEDGAEDELQLPDERFSPETELERKELRRAVDDGLRQLPADYRNILVLRELNGLSYDEIAQALEMEVGTVKSRIFRARKKLCAILLRHGNIADAVSSYKSKGV